MRIFQVDAFTRTRYTGNPATVVLGADGCDDAALMALAREYPHAEAAFVLAPEEPMPGGERADLRLRFFNARKEAPFVGHATIAAHAVLLTLGLRGAGVARQASGTGIIDVTATAAAGGAPLVEFRQPVPELDAPLSTATTLRVAAALGLTAAHLHGSLRACLARRGGTRLLVPVDGAQALDAITADSGALLALGTELGADGFFVFAQSGADGGGGTDSRMFCPALGIVEDPVSGNAHAMLAAYLWKSGRLGERSEFVGRQGRQMSRPGEVRVRMQIEAGELRSVRIGGHAVIVSAGTLTG